jgi:hypothetical protein
LQHCAPPRWHFPSEAEGDRWLSQPQPNLRNLPPWQASKNARDHSIPSASMLEVSPVGGGILQAKYWPSDDIARHVRPRMTSDKLPGLIELDGGDLWREPLARLDQRRVNPCARNGASGQPSRDPFISVSGPLTAHDDTNGGDSGSFGFGEKDHLREGGHFMHLSMTPEPRR